MDASLRLIEEIESGQFPTLEADLGGRLLDIDSGSLGWTQDVPLEATIACLEATGGLVALRDSDDATSFEIASELGWSRACFRAVHAKLQPTKDCTVDLGVTPDMAHVAQIVVRVACSGGITADPEVVTTGSARSSLPGVADLDRQQRAAVEAPGDRDLMINAGAGSGKTHTLSYRIAHLISELGVFPSRCLVLTFSNAAKLQIRGRLNGLAGAGYAPLADVEVRTIHSLARQLLLNAARLGRTRLRPRFEIVPEEDQRVNGVRIRARAPFVDGYDLLFGGIEDTLTLKDRLQLYPAAIDALRSGHPDYGIVLTPEDVSPVGEITVVSARTGRFRALQSSNVRVVWQRYSTALQERNQIDFVGLIAEAIDAIRRHASLKSLLAGAYDFVFIDEYQDTTRAQNELVLAMAEGGARLNVVGDVDQTIMSFAGASADNFMSFSNRVSERLHRSALVLPLETNYRSRQEIVTLANSVIDNNRIRLPKAMSASNRSPVEEGHVLRAQGELRYVAPWIALRVQALLDKHVDPSEVAVLFRKQANDSPQERVVWDHLMKLQIPVSDDASSQDAVRVLSIHGAKGLEFDHVFTLYLGNGHFPDRRGDPEEERRLLYVAITRARIATYICGSVGASPDLFEETNVEEVLPSTLRLEKLSQVLASGYNDPWSDFADDDFDWDEPMEEEESNG